MNIHQYKVGDRARVTKNRALCSHLMEGEEVEILRVDPQPQRGYDSYVVTGGWSLHYQVLEPIFGEQVMIFSNKTTRTIRKIERVETDVILSQRDGEEWEVIDVHKSKCELTAQAFLHYLCLWHKDNGYERD